MSTEDVLYSYSLAGEPCWQCSFSLHCTFRCYLYPHSHLQLIYPVFSVATSSTKSHFTHRGKSWFPNAPCHVHNIYTSFSMFFPVPLTPFLFLRILYQSSTHKSLCLCSKYIIYPSCIVNSLQAATMIHNHSYAISELCDHGQVI